MEEEMAALQANKTWEFSELPAGKRAVGCRWVYTVKFLPDGTVERLKARLVAKEYTHRPLELTTLRRYPLLLNSIRCGLLYPLQQIRTGLSTN